MDPALLSELQRAVVALRAAPTGGVAEGLVLGSSERLVLAFDAQLWRSQSRRTRHRSGGASLRVPIIGGMSVRVGGGQGTSERELPQLEPVGEGRALITDERLCLLGPGVTDDVDLRRVLAVDLDQSDGLVAVHVNRRRAPLVLQPQGLSAERAAAYLGLAGLVRRDGWDEAANSLGAGPNAAPPSQPSSSSAPKPLNPGTTRPIIPMRQPPPGGSTP
jgi:hypothetical protein